MKLMEWRARTFYFIARLYPSLFSTPYKCLLERCALKIVTPHSIRLHNSKSLIFDRFLESGVWEALWIEFKESSGNRNLTLRWFALLRSSQEPFRFVENTFRLMAIRTLFLFILYGKSVWTSFPILAMATFCYVCFCKIFNLGRAETSETSSLRRTVYIIWLSTPFWKLILSYTISLREKETALKVFAVLV